MIGGIAAQLAPDRLAHRAARAITTHDIAGPDGLDVALVPGIEPLEANGHRVVFKARRRRDPDIEQAPRIIWLEPGLRFAHDVEKAIMHARLIQNHMREFR